MVFGSHVFDNLGKGNVGPRKGKKGFGSKPPVQEVEEVEVEERSQLHSIGSVMNMLKSNPSLLRMFTPCVR